MTQTKQPPANPGRFTHPFERELGGRSWVFAHNGKLDGLRDDPTLVSHRFLPIGETDSEFAFCLLLEAIARGGDEANSLCCGVVEAIRHLIRRLSRIGEFNFLLSDGECLFVHAHTHMNMLHRHCLIDGCEQEVVLLATSPLTDEIWTPLTGLHAFADGREWVHSATLLSEETLA